MPLPIPTWRKAKPSPGFLRLEHILRRRPRALRHGSGQALAALPMKDCLQKCSYYLSQLHKSPRRDCPAETKVMQNAEVGSCQRLNQVQRRFEVGGHPCHPCHPWLCEIGIGIGVGIDPDSDRAHLRFVAGFGNEVGPNCAAAHPEGSPHLACRVFGRWGEPSG